MTVITLNEAKQNLDQIVDRVLADTEPTIVATDDGEQIVLLSMDEFKSWKETLYLLSSPANATHLRKSLDEARAGKVQEKELIET